MSPPIRDGSGDSIGSIRLGDGSEISEVRTGAGDVLFSGSAIPDSAIAQFDFRKEDGSLPLTDQTGTGNDLSNGSYTGVGKTINGNQAGEFDGGDDRIFGTLSSALSQPFTVILVIQADVNDEHYVFNGTSNTSLVGQTGGSETGWFVNAGADSFTGGSRDTNAHILTGVFDSTDSVRLDSTELASGDAGSNGLSGINLGSLNGGGNYWDGAIGFVEVHNGLPSNGLSSRESEIATDWGITI